MKKKRPMKPKNQPGRTDPFPQKLLVECDGIRESLGKIVGIGQKKDGLDIGILLVGRFQKSDRLLPLPGRKKRPRKSTIESEIRILVLCRRSEHLDRPVTVPHRLPGQAKTHKSGTHLGIFFENLLEENHRLLIFSVLLQLLRFGEKSVYIQKRLGFRGSHQDPCTRTEKHDPDNEKNDF